MTDGGKSTASKPHPGTPNFVKKRFYRDVAVAEADGGFGICLDGKPVRTPGRAMLAVPARALAEAIAEEWRAQGEFIDPISMPLTRFANTAIDGVAPRIGEVRADAAKYAGTDLVCYRAERPAALAERQAAAWDPVLAAAGMRLGTSFQVTAGVMPAVQASEALDRVRHWFEKQDAFALAALHVITTITCSALLAIAHAEGDLDIGTVWQNALVDEDYQMELWGRDGEAMAVRERRWRDIEAAARFLDLSRA